tara:strand:+ start:141 stop:344 length:204 start_codon:yes stop_codon:yes gene_type:complete
MYDELYKENEMVRYVISVIEPDKQYNKHFDAKTLDDCRQLAQEYLWQCPDETKYIYIATRIINDRKF